MREQIKIIGFATAVCLVCSVVLAGVSYSLRERQEANKENDIKSKVLQVFAIKGEDGAPVSGAAEIKRVFDENIKGIVLDAEGNLIENKQVSDLSDDDINARDKETGLKKYYPLYIYTDPKTSRKLYAIHVSGKGLWSTIKGYMALEDDLSTIFGIVFYENQETPGLGAEVAKAWFQDKFKGKKWFENGKINKFRIIKPGGQLDDHTIDGITAATLTCNGVDAFLNQDFVVYNKYFVKGGLRK